MKLFCNLRIFSRTDREKSMIIKMFTDKLLVKETIIDRIKELNISDIGEDI